VRIKFVIVTTCLLITGCSTTRTSRVYSDSVWCAQNVRSELEVEYRQRGVGGFDNWYLLCENSDRFEIGNLIRELNMKVANFTKQRSSDSILTLVSLNPRIVISSTFAASQLDISQNRLFEIKDQSQNDEEMTLRERVRVPQWSLSTNIEVIAGYIQVFIIDDAGAVCYAKVDLETKNKIVTVGNVEFYIEYITHDTYSVSRVKLR